MSTQWSIIAELALRAYLQEHSSPPAQLEQLVPDYLPQVLADPFDPVGGPLHYEPDGETCVLYSLGPDRDDDGGRPMPRSEYGGLDMDGEGDLRLDCCFNKEESAPPAETDEADDDAAVDGSDASD